VRVVHVLTDPRGGGGIHALALAREARTRGDTVRFVSPEPVGTGFETLPLRGLPSRRVRQLLRRSDLVHLHGVRAALLPVRLGGPVIVTTHGLHALRGTTGAVGSLARAATRAALARADLIVCPSEDERADVAGLGRRFSRKIEVIANGVEHADAPTREERRAARMRLGLDESVPVLLFLGGLRRQKDPLLAVDAVRRAQRRIPELRLVIAGAGPLRREVESAAGPNIELLGWRDDPSVLLAACDALLNTSRWEGLPLSLLEALWRGRPVIACDAPGNAEAIGDGGVIVHGRDPQQLADAITSAFQTPGTLEELGRRGRARAMREFDEHRMALATLALYDVLAEPSRSPGRHRWQLTSARRAAAAGLDVSAQPTDPRAARAPEAVVRSVRP
jgi:glycosyltransferase involved in cell wall biosynthesis